MPVITIDGRLIESAAGKTIIEAAYEHGITIPHFCWHPALSVAGNCRMCMVHVGNHKKDKDGTFLFDDNGHADIAWMPKLQIACATTIADGMVVDTVGKHTKDGQNAVMEFLLINHPLDCPICDEAGQCKLQEYAFNHSQGQSRFDEEKVHKPKRVVLGPEIMFDSERCIMCSRCIRFADEVAHQPVLTFTQRNDKVTIETFPGTEFDSPYSMNVIDICPVGALTSIDFRFRARVWEMSFTDSICPGCARGCNIKVGIMNNEVLRVEPRTNMHVNEYWMCDYGRLATPDVINQNRVNGPHLRTDGSLILTTWERALEFAAQAIRSVKPSQIMVLGSAHASNEDNYALSRFAQSVVKTNNIDFIKHIDHEFGDAFLRVNEMAPNAIGAHTAGIAPAHGGHTVDELAMRIRHGDIKILIILEDSAEAHSHELAEAVASVGTLIVLSSHMSVTAHQASVLLPVASFAECEGTFTNILHRVQRFEQVLSTKDHPRTVTMKNSRWDKFGAPNDRWTKGTRRDVRPGWAIVQDIANMMGAGWTFASAKDVFAHATHHVSAFEQLNYELIVQHQGAVLGKAHHPEKSVPMYESHYMKPQ